MGLCMSIAGNAAACKQTVRPPSEVPKGKYICRVDQIRVSRQKITLKIKVTNILYLRSNHMSSCEVIMASSYWVQET